MGQKHSNEKVPRRVGGGGDSQDTKIPNIETCFKQSIDSRSLYYPGFNCEPIFFYSPSDKPKDEPKFNVFKTKYKSPENCSINSYAFTAKPFQFGESFVLRINDCHSSLQYPGALGLGFLSCDPISFCFDLGLNIPEGGGLDDLLGRQRYWAIEPTEGECQVGDEFCINFEQTGEIRVGGNGGTSRLLMYGNKAAPLWVFFTVSGSMEICLLGKGRSDRMTQGPYT